MEGKDPVKIIRNAIAKALVFYYPFAGRLREYDDRKLVVECTGEGVVFIEADADVTLQQFGDVLYPPFPNVEELLYDVPGSSGLINCPLLLFQVTPLKYGGFIVAFRFNHTMCDGAGFIKFLFPTGELARGASVPIVQPVWQRHLFSARYPPRVLYPHHEYAVVPETKGTLIPLTNTVHCPIFFDAHDIASLRRTLPPQLRSCSRFELLTACIWRCRTAALSLNPSHEVRMVCVVDIRRRFDPPLPAGCYGNAVVIPAAITTAEKLVKSPLQYAVELVITAKNEATEEYMKSVADLMAIRNRPDITMAGSYLVSDLSHNGFNEVDFAWGKPLYTGPATLGSIPDVASFFLPFKDNKGGNGIVTSISLPQKAMDVFGEELDMMINTARRSLINVNASAL